MSPSARRATRPIELLLVEDNPGDVRLTMEALKESTMRTRVSHVPDGEQAMLFLRREGEYASAPRPDLVLLDLNLPRKDGREVLADLKGDPALRSIPVIILTTSDSSEDIRRAYGLHANCYITKPADFSEFVRVVRQVEDFWLSIAKLPP
ncbi:MAG: response regulator [Thermoplasmatota archaeon]